MLTGIGPDRFIPLVPSSASNKRDSAEVLQYGNKAVTLDRLIDHFEKNPIEGVIPLGSYKIASGQVEGFLKFHAPDCFEDWKKICELFHEAPGQFFENPEADRQIRALQEKIEKAFTLHPLPIEMRVWPEVHSGYFMVRSTGAEDTSQTANAGMHLSEKYKTSKEVPASLGRVVSSYFNKEALSNRLQGGDDPFTSNLHLAVMVQDLIGETEGSIPISAVLFTNDPQYVGQEAFHIMELSAAYGHGEGIVNNLGIATETVFILQSTANPEEFYIWYDRQDKLTRLAPVKTPQGVELEQVDNPPELVKKEALNTETLKKIFSMGLQIEKVIEKAADIEFVIKDGTIYIVQARSVNRPVSTPSYLDLEASQIIASEPVAVLVPGREGVVTVNRKDELLVKETLRQAQFAWDKTIHQAAVVKTPEPANSHPTVNMKEKQAPSFYHAAGLDTLKGQVSEERPLVVCVQQGIAAIAQAPVIREGHISHVASLRCNLNGLPDVGTSLPPEDLRILIQEIKLAKVKETAQKAFEKLSHHPLLQPRHVKARQLAAPYGALQERVQATLKELGASLEQAQEGEKMKVLFYAKAVETLLWGAECSIVRLEALDQKLTAFEEKLGGKQAELGEESLLTAMNEKTNEDWQEFLVRMELDHSAEERVQLKLFLSRLGKAKSLWLNFYFSQAKGESNNSAELLKKLLSQMDEPSTQFIENLQSEIRFLDHFQPELIEDPALFQESFKQLKKGMEVFTKSEFTQRFKEATPLARLLAVKQLGIFIGKYDNAMKALRTSGSYNEEDKINRFKEMLDVYFNAMKIFAGQLINKHTLSSFNNSVDTNIRWMEKKFKELKKGYESTESFIVNNVVLGSAAAIERHLDMDLSFEDFFTWTHQNILASIGSLVKDNLSIETGLTPTMQAAVDMFSQGELKGNLIGVEQDSGTLSLKYNVTLGYHSCVFTLHEEHEKLLVKVELIGIGGKRFAICGLRCALLDGLGVIKFANGPILQKDLLQFSLQMDSQEQIRTVYQTLQHIYWEITNVIIAKSDARDKKIDIAPPSDEIEAIYQGLKQEGSTLYPELMAILWNWSYQADYLSLVRRESQQYHLEFIDTLSSDPEFQKNLNEALFYLHRDFFNESDMQIEPYIYPWLEKLIANAATLYEHQFVDYLLKGQTNKIKLGLHLLSKQSTLDRVQKERFLQLLWDDLKWNSLGKIENWTHELLELLSLSETLLPFEKANQIIRSLVDKTPAPQLHLFAQGYLQNFSQALNSRSDKFIWLLVADPTDPEFKDRMTVLLADQDIKVKERAIDLLYDLVLEKKIADPYPLLEPLLKEADQFSVVNLILVEVYNQRNLLASSKDEIVNRINALIESGQMDSNTTIDLLDGNHFIDPEGNEIAYRLAMALKGELKGFQLLLNLIPQDRERATRTISDWVQEPAFCQNLYAAIQTTAEKDPEKVDQLLFLIPIAMQANDRNKLGGLNALKRVIESSGKGINVAKELISQLQVENLSMGLRSTLKRLQISILEQEF